MSARIHGTLLTPRGDLAVSTPVPVYLVEPIITAGGTASSGAVQPVPATDTAGVLDVVLPTPAHGYAHYVLRLPDGRALQAVVQTGETWPVELLASRTLAPVEPDRLLELIAIHNRDPYAHPQLATGGTTVDSNRITARAGQVLSGHRAVWPDGQGVVRYASATDATAELVAGITLHAADLGATIAIQTAGELEEPSWAWQPGIVWLGTNGTLTQTPPLLGATVPLGTPLSATRLLLRVQHAIFLES